MKEILVRFLEYLLLGGFKIMENSAENKKNEWVRRLASFACGGIVMSAIIWFAPGLSKSRSADSETNRIVEIKKPEIKVEVKPEVRPEPKIVIEKLVVNSPIIIPSKFRRYKITLDVEFAERTEVNTAIADLKKACSVIETSPTIKKIKPVCAKGVKRIEGKDVEFKLGLEE